MRMIKANPQPYGGEADDRWLLPSTKPNTKGGLYFTYPCISIDNFEHIPCKGGVFDGVAPERGMELMQIDSVWYWICA